MSFLHKFYKTVAVLLMPLLLGSTGIPAVYASGESFSSSNVSGEIFSSIPLSLQINGSGNDVLELNLFVPKGNFVANGAALANVSATGTSTGTNILKYTGTRANLNAVLASMTYVGTTTGAVTVEAYLGIASSSDFAYNLVNQHVYRVVNASSTWDEALALAASSSFNGIPGYLATITTEQESNFVLTRINQDGWIAGSDAAVEGEWRWMAGPEAGTLFWTGTSSGSVAPGQYANWNPVEPNNAGGGEDCLEIRFSAGSNGKWNDLACSSPRPNFVIEFGTPGNLPSLVQTTFTITVIQSAANAIQIIQNYSASGGTTTAPTLLDYQAAGVNGVVSGNLASINTVIAGTNPANLTNVSQIQNVLNPAISTYVINSYITSGGTTTAPTVADYQNAGLTGVTAQNLAQVNASVSQGGSAANLAAIQALVDVGVSTAAAQAASQRPVYTGSARMTAVSGGSSSYGSTALPTVSCPAGTVLSGQVCVSVATSMPVSVPTLSAQFTQNLSVGTTHPEVRQLQKYLNARGFIVSATGPGSAGNETAMFGSLTRSALARFQKANAISPSVGYFGILTRTFVNSGK